MLRPRAPSLPAIAVLLAFASGALLLARPPQPRTWVNELGRPMLPRPELLKILGAGYQHLVVDFLWVQMLQIASKARTPAEHLPLYDYTMLIADLEPKFRHVYFLGGGLLTVKDLEGRWHNGAESTAVLRRGISELPESVPLRLLLAHNLIFIHSEREAAISLLEETAKLPEAPPFVGALARVLREEREPVQTQLYMTEALYHQTEAPLQRRKLARRIAELKGELELSHLRRAVGNFQAQFGRLPRDVEEVVSTGVMTRPPVDPVGGRFVLDRDGTPLLVDRPPPAEEEEEE